MYTVTVLYSEPDDPEEFDRYYEEVHIPLARKMAGLASWTVQRVRAQDGPAASKFHMVVQLAASTAEALEAVLGSPEGRAASDDVPNFATGGAVFLYGQSHELIAPPLTQQ